MEFGLGTVWPAGDAGDRAAPGDPQHAGREARARPAGDRGGRGDVELVRPQVDPCVAGLGVRVVGIVDRDAVPERAAVFDAAVVHVHVAEEVHHERRGRLVEHLVGRALLLDLAVVHHHDVVGEFECLLLVVGDEHARHADLVVQPAEPLPQFDPHLRVERPEGLIEQQDLRPDGEGPGEGHPLPLPSRQLRRLAAPEPLEPHEPEEFVHAGRHLRLRHLPHAKPEGHVLEHVHVAEERVVLEHEAHLARPGMPFGDVLAVLLDQPLVGKLEAGDDPQERGLARARRAEQRQQRAVRHVERHAIERPEAAKRL